MSKLALAAIAWIFVSAANPAHAQELKWNDEWPRFRSIGYALTGASVAAALAVTVFIPFPDEPGWRGGILFDDAVRASVRLRPPTARDAVRVASDVTLISTVLHVGLVDGLFVPLARGSTRVATQLTLMNAQAFSLNILVATLLFKTVARERPLVESCRGNPGYDPLCGAGDYASFPSSHTSTAFTSAGLTCVHHEYLPIYGGAWDSVACASSLTVALATGVFRVLGDRHYATDAIVGAVAGFSLGYIYPWLFHYSYDLDDDEQRSSASSLQWALIPGGTPEAPYGFSIAGAF
jgi:membrane-associated phospholipid phosphatase